MVDRLVAVDDADYRFNEPVRMALAADVANPGTELGAAVEARTFVLDTDYATLEEALSATAVGGVLEIRGAWSRATTFTIDKSCTVRFVNGGSITQTTDTHGITITSSGVTLQGVDLTGLGSSTAGSASAIYAAGGAGAPLEHIVISGGTVVGWRKHGIWLEQATNFTIADVTLRNIAYGAIMVMSGVNGRVSGNHISNVTMPSGFTNSYGIAISRDSSQAIAAAPRSSGVIVEGNYVSGVPWEGLDTHAGENLTFRDNHVIGCKTGIAIVGGKNELGNGVYGPLGVSVSGNYVSSLLSDGTPGAGILFVGAGDVIGTPIQEATGQVVDNTIVDHGFEATASTASGGIVAYYTRGLLVQGNRIVRAGRYGIQAYHSNVELALVDNRIEDVWSNASTSIAVYARSGYNTMTLAGTNIVRGSKTATSVNGRGLSAGTITSTAITDGGGNTWQNATDLPTAGVNAVLKASTNGAAPVVRAAAISAPTAPGATYLQAEAASMKTAVDAIRVALTNYGITF